MAVQHTEDPAPDDGRSRWRSRRVLAALVTAAVYLVPVALSIASATVVAHLLSRPRGAADTVAWWAAVLLVPTAVLVVSDRVARRALPLAVLLRITMVFPDQAPKRLAVARRAGSTRDLARRVAHAREHGVADEPVRAAERILGLAAALNAHDRLTRGHAERVRAYTDLIADRLQLPDADRDRLRWSALLHDIGKLAVHPEVLNKPDKLSDEEWEVVRQHPLEGARLTAPLASWLGEWANTIAEHHEKFDGTGYPYALAGHGISLGGRIVAVADCYDTMTTLRSYRRPMSHAAARTELAACAGTHFDPRVVRAFLEVSINRLRPITGPLSWIGSIPFVGNVPSLGQAVATLGQAGAAIVAVAGAVTVGVLHAATGASHPAPTPAQALARNVTPGDPSSAGNPGGSGKSAGGGSGGSASGGGGENVPGSSTGGGAAGSDNGQAGSAGTPGSSGSSGSDGSSGSSGMSPSSPGDTDPPKGTTTTMAGGTKSPTTTIAGTTTTTVPVSNGTLVIRNGSGGNAGRPEQGDQIVVTFASPPRASALCSAWTTSASHSLNGPNVVVTGTKAGADNTLTVTDTGDCAGGFHFGTIDLGQAGYFSGSSATFGGTNLLTCNGVLELGGCGTIAWDGHSTLTITLGQASTGQPTNKTPDVATYTPDPALGVVGPIKSPSEVEF